MDNKSGELISPFKKCLFWPKTLEKTEKRKKIVIPAVVSSEKWKKFYKANEDNKKNKTKRTKIDLTPDSEDLICKKCKHSFNEERKKKLSRKWVECDTCKNTYHFKCVPKNHIESFGLTNDDDDDFGLLLGDD